MNPDVNILIMAAGLGTRMKSNRAKVLHELDGRPLVNHVVESALALDPKSVCVIVGHQGEDVKAAVKAEFSDGRVRFALQERQLGTGDAINCTRDLYADADSTIVVLTGDVPLITSDTIRGLIDHHKGENAAATLLAVELEDPFGYGRVCRDRDGGFAKIVEQKDASTDELLGDEINAGFYCFDSPKLFATLSSIGNDNAQGEYYLTDVPGIFKGKGEKVAIYVAPDAREVEGVNDRRQLATLENALREKTIKRLMLESGVTFIDPSSAYISARATVGRDTVIYPNVTIEGTSTLGENCIIRSGTRIHDSKIGDNVEIRDNCLIRDSEVGDECTLGPMAHLRGHAVMRDGSKVGNFVELKKTNLGRNSKASHLTYLGDATVGEDTNIGAGTVTCNYDGKNKHETHIGDRVKIGSDTMLVAPVTVNDGAVTGAGSVVTKDVEKGTLVAGVPARKLKDIAGGG
ncbi:MAG: bifunctional UDP-N-acetylglucosamine diphosphorylase/glucosamine-1-phosphate N-acetyltransferase GlmU [Acidobacteria bacterium]|nr:bifunctional UDP-N-acetylglucosamine diphosphorylase/glucosamine-1-phosphate N-acetyltransferase GlmU [Acidobacteriota bacterium]